MDNNKFRDLLDQLQNEIKNTQTVDQQGHQLLRDLDQDIHSLLERADERSEEEASDSQDTFVERLEGVLYHFEATHPTLTVVISKVLDSLSGAGI